jgi:hypothetical protein
MVKDIASLYEYWLFFTLYDFNKRKKKFNIQSTHFDESVPTFVPSNDGLNVMVKSGKHTARLTLKRNRI